MRGWLYTNTLQTISGERGIDISSRVLYVLYSHADRYQIPAFKNAIIDQFLDRILDRRPSYRALKAFCALPPQSAFYRAFINGMAAHILQRDNMAVLAEEKVSYWTAKALADLARRLADANWRSVHGGEASEFDKCNYHEHPEGVRCPGSQPGGMETE